MARKKRQKLQDPSVALKRQERIRTMLAAEAAGRKNLDHVLRAGKALGDQAHYDGLIKKHAADIPVLVEQVTRARSQMLELVGQCGVANYELRRERDHLQVQLDALEGRPPRADPLASLDLSSLPIAQVQALKLVMALHADPNTSALRLDPFPLAKAQIDPYSRILEQLRKTFDAGIVAAEEKVRRGWMDESAVGQARTQREVALAGLEADRDKFHDTLQSFATEHTRLAEQRAQLAQALVERKASRP